jgi:heptosyltransferase I
MRVLVVKTSSMGDVIHTLPALTDAAKVFPDIKFDWVVEESFAQIPSWHSHVEKVIPIAWRRWRKNLFAKNTWREIKTFWKNLRAEHYDLIIDAQGLVKSAVIARLAKGKKAGLDWGSAREPVASFGYQQKCKVNFYQHAIARMRSIFSLLLGYSLPQNVPEYGIPREQFYGDTAQEDYLVFLHGTTWTTKLWPEEFWVQLGQLAEKAGFIIKLLWGNPAERERANRIASQVKNAVVLDRLDLLGSARVLANARAIVAVDTGFAHLSAALDVPGVSLFGPTNPAYSGVLGQHQINLTANLPCVPCLKRTCTYLGRTSPEAECFKTLTPDNVWKSLVTICHATASI